ncbi:hypothetical protein Pfo_019597 [Paulownia fortunei]|nr:hypothetical protein Pfo_019597 [Paulownia fortunei]
MALLASCWLIVEFYIIPDGYLKWFYLSFYIHPLFLAFCQIFLWLKELQRWLLLLFFFPFRIACYLSLSIFRFLNRVALLLFSFTRPTTVEDFYGAMDQEIPQAGIRGIVVSCSSSWNSTCSPCQVVNKTRVQSGVFEMGNESKLGSNFDTYEATHETDHDTCTRDSWLNEYLSSDHYNSSLLTYDPDMTDSLFSTESIVSSSTEILLEHNCASFQSSSMDQDVDFKLQDPEINSMNTCPQPHEDISGFVSLSKLKTSPSSINQEFIHETEDSEISSSPLLEDTLTVSQEGSVSPISNSTDDCYTLSAEDLLVDHEYLPAFCSSNSPVRASEQQLISRSVEEDMDPFHQKYTERMRFFDVLYHERLHGMNAILNEHLTSPGLFESTESSTDLSMQYTWWIRMARKRLLRSLECDFELIYVAQSCLFWEALHHQYQKVEALTFSDNSENGLFHHSVSGKFQEIQILLVRFVEEQKSEGRRYSNYTHKRLSFQGLLRVPDVTGFMEEENNSMGGEGIRATQVLKAIEKCIKAFWLYVKTDSKKSLWKYKGIWRTPPPVEDPQDLELLHYVTKALHKKGIMLKDLQGKNKCWLRRKVKPLQSEHEKRSLLFAMMDMKLVQRLLKMPLISTSHLNWCQEKLNNLEFKEGHVFRCPTSHLFPS